MQNTVFIFRNGTFGDSIVALPSIRLIKQKNSNSKIVLITKSHNKPGIFAEEVFSSAKLIDETWFYSNLASIISLISKLRNVKNKKLYYLAEERKLYVHLRNFLFFSLGEFKKKIGFFVHSKKDKLKTEYLRLVETINEHYAEDIFKTPFFTPSEKEVKKADSLLSNFNNLSLIAINLSSGMPSKDWQFENYLKMVKNISEYKKNTAFILFGGSKDFETSEQFKKAINFPILNLSGKTSLLESAELISRCKFYLGNDTGTMHLASSMGVPCIAIFSARDRSNKWIPFGNKNILIRKKVKCENCMLTKCEKQNNLCTKLITVEEVWKSVKNFLD